MRKIPLRIPAKPNKLGKCKIAEAKFIFPPNTKAVDRPSYRAPPPASKESLKKIVAQMAQDGVAKKRPRQSQSPANAILAFISIGYRAAINKDLARET